jgi:hypothetical protein
MPRDVEYEIDAISRTWPVQRARRVATRRGGEKCLRSVEECRVPEETEAGKEVRTPTI